MKREIVRHIAAKHTHIFRWLQRQWHVKYVSLSYLDSDSFAIRAIQRKASISGASISAPTVSMCDFRWFLFVFFSLSLLLFWGEQQFGFASCWKRDTIKLHIPPFDNVTLMTFEGVAYFDLEYFFSLCSRIRSHSSAWQIIYLGFRTITAKAHISCILFWIRAQRWNAVEYSQPLFVACGALATDWSHFSVCAFRSHFFFGANYDLSLARSCARP